MSRGVCVGAPLQEREKFLSFLRQDNLNNDNLVGFLNRELAEYYDICVISSKIPKDNVPMQDYYCYFGYAKSKLFKKTFGLVHNFNEYNECLFSDYKKQDGAITISGIKSNNELVTLYEDGTSLAYPFPKYVFKCSLNDFLNNALKDFELSVKIQKLGLVKIIYE